MGDRMRPGREDIRPTHDANPVESDELNSVIGDALADEPLDFSRGRASICARYCFSRATVSRQLRKLAALATAMGEMTTGI